MKASSYFFLGSVLVVFVAIQGWILMATFVAPRVFTATEAVITGKILEVRSPVQGTLDTVNALDNQTVEEGQMIFVLKHVVQDPVTQLWHEDTLPITALRGGTITGIQTVRGTFVQADQKLATIVDNSPEALTVSARLSVSPNDVPRIRRLLSATVQADFLNGGRPIDAIVSVVSPTYDAYAQILSVSLQLLQYPDGITSLPLGLPVHATVTVDRTSDDNIVVSLFNKFFQPSEAQQ